MREAATWALGVAAELLMHCSSESVRWAWRMERSHTWVKLSDTNCHKVLNVLCSRTERETVREFCTIHSRVCLALDQRRFSAIRAGWSGLMWPLRTAATAMLCWKTHVVSRRRLTRLKLIKYPNLSMILVINGQAWLNPYWSLSAWQKERSWRLAWRPKVHNWKKLRTSRWGLHEKDDDSMPSKRSSCTSNWC